MEKSTPSPGEQAAAAPKKTGRRSGKWLLILIAALLVLAGVLALVHFLRKPAATDLPYIDAIPQPIALREIVPAEGGSIRIPLHDGTILTPDEDSVSAYVSGDEKHLVILNKEGLLYDTDAKLAQRTILSQNAQYIAFFCETGLIYFTNDGHMHRFHFDTQADLDLGKIQNCRNAAQDLSLLYNTAEGIFLLPEQEREPRKISNNDHGVGLISVSAGGEMAAWYAADKDGVTRACLYDGSQTEALFTAETVVSKAPVHSYSEDGKLALIYIPADGNGARGLWIKEKGKDAVPVELDSEFSGISTQIYTRQDLLSLTDSRKINGFYFGNGDQLYWLSRNGTLKTLLRGITDSIIKDGFLAFTSPEHTLLLAQLRDDSVTEPILLAENAHSFRMSPTWEYVYYQQNQGLRKSTLYCLKLGEETAKKVDTVDTDYSLNTLRTSPDGSVLFYCKNTMQNPDNYSRNGLFLMWDYASGKASEIADKVDFSARLPMITAQYSCVDPNGLLYAVRDTLQDPHAPLKFYRWDGQAAQSADNS